MTSPEHLDFRNPSEALRQCIQDLEGAKGRIRELEAERAHLEEAAEFLRKRGSAGGLWGPEYDWLNRDQALRAKPSPFAEVRCPDCSAVFASGKARCPVCGLQFGAPAKPSPSLTSREVPLTAEQRESLSVGDARLPGAAKPSPAGCMVWPNGTPAEAVFVVPPAKPETIAEQSGKKEPRFSVVPGADNDEFYVVDRVDKNAPAGPFTTRLAASKVADIREAEPGEPDATAVAEPRTGRLGLSAPPRCQTCKGTRNHRQSLGRDGKGELIKCADAWHDSEPEETSSPSPPAPAELPRRSPRAPVIIGPDRDEPPAPVEAPLTSGDWREKVVTVLASVCLRAQARVDGPAALALSAICEALNEKP